MTLCICSSECVCVSTCVCARVCAYVCVCVLDCIIIVSIMYIIHCMCINKPLVYMYYMYLGYVNFYHIWPCLQPHMYMYCHANTLCTCVVRMTLWYIKKLPCLCAWGCDETRGINRLFDMLLLIAHIWISLFSFSLPPSSDSDNGYIHLRIVQETDNTNQIGYVFGQFSSHFSTVAECIAFYTKQRLNIRGAEHKKLRYPVPRASDTMASFRV